MIERIRDWSIILYAASVWLVWPALEGHAQVTRTVLECPPDLPDGFTCVKTLIITEDAGTPPVEPPPVEPPPGGGDSQRHFDEACELAGIVACRDYGSETDVLDAAAWGTGVNNTPSNPRTNSRCRWNGGDRDCYPAFEQGDCADHDRLQADPGQAQENDWDRAQLWSPCFDPGYDAVRYHYWRNLTSSIGTTNAYEFPTSVPLRDGYWLQLELALSPEFFQRPQGSNNAKLARLNRVKNEACPFEDRLFDVRFGQIDPAFVTLGMLAYCGGGYAPNEHWYTIPVADAGRWHRATWHVNLVDNYVDFWVIDPMTGEVLWQTRQTENRDDKVPIDFYSHVENTIYGGPKLHSSSHTANEIDHVGPHLWVRHWILSTEEIAR